jgi:hypothetical protein
MWLVMVALVIAAVALIIWAIAMIPA